MTVLNYWNFQAGEAPGVQQQLLRATVPRSDTADGILRDLGTIAVGVRYASVYGDLRQAR